MQTLTEQFWDGATLYVRFAPDEDWDELPLLPRPDVSAESVPYNSPLWLLDALGTDAAEVVGEDEVRGTSTTRIRLTVGTARAVAASPSGLRLPALPADAFPAEIWVDSDGRIWRMGCTWPTRRLPRFLRKRSHWITTEMWDFGTNIDPPPAFTTG